MSWMQELAVIKPDSVNQAIELLSEQTGAPAEDLFVIVTFKPSVNSKPYPGRPDRHLMGFSAICTHMGCRLVRAGDALTPDSVTGDLVCGPCPCHGTVFNLSKGGVVVLGPASQHLPQLALSFSEDRTVLRAVVQPGVVPPAEENWPVDA